MTWGSIDGTPTRIDSDSRPYTASGPSFKMPKISTRERIASSLVDQAIKRTREQKKNSPGRYVKLSSQATTQLLLNFSVYGPFFFFFLIVEEELEQHLQNLIDCICFHQQPENLLVIANTLIKH